MSSFAARLCLGAVFAVVLISCATAPHEAEPPRVIEGVPFYPQAVLQCGPASLAGVMNFWDAGVTTDEIAAAIYSPTARGTLDLDMALFARSKGFEALQYEGSVEDIKANINAGRPLIVLIDMGNWLYRQDHYMVIVGYSAEGLIANSGSRENLFVPMKDFLKSWEKTGRWTLLVKPE